MPKKYRSASLNQEGGVFPAVDTWMTLYLTQSTEAPFDKKTLDEYYEIVGWDKLVGIPTDKKLRELGLEKFK